MNDIDAIRERHQGDLYCGYIDPVRGLIDHGFATDCDTRVVLDAKHEEVEALTTELIFTNQKHAETRADADRLAEALGGFHDLDGHAGFPCNEQCPPCVNAREALRQHEEATK